MTLTYDKVGTLNNGPERNFTVNVAIKIVKISNFDFFSNTIMIVNNLLKILASVLS